MDKIIIVLPQGQVHIRATDEGIVCDIHTPSGKRLIGTWASTDEIEKKLILVTQ